MSKKPAQIFPGFFDIPYEVSMLEDVEFPSTDFGRLIQHPQRSLYAGGCRKNHHGLGQVNSTSPTKFLY